jgi:hypothetical protein
MPTSTTTTTPSNSPRAATSVRPKLADVLPQLLAKAGVRDRTNLQKQLDALDAQPAPDRARVWRQLLSTLGSLVPLSPVTAGMHVVTFFRPDGKYRMQVFALEDANDGAVHLYLPDVLSMAVEKKLVLAGPVGVDGQKEYTTIGAAASRRPMTILPVDDRTLPNPPAHVKNLTGWKRKAIRITLDADAAPDDRRVATAIALCEMAAAQWANDPSAVVYVRPPVVPVA